MGAPSINISFIEKAISAITRGERGIVMLWVKDSLPVANPATVLLESDIPDGVSAESAEQIKLAMMGYTNAPKKVLVYGMGIPLHEGIETEESSAFQNLKDEQDEIEAGYQRAMEASETIRFDYLAVPTVETDGKAQDVAAWVKSMRDNKKKKIKAVLPNVAADNEGVINYTTSKAVRTVAETNKDGNRVSRDVVYTAEQYCARIAGLIAGTPMSISSTYAPLPELSDCTRLTDNDIPVDKGQFIIFHDGEKVKVVRGVNSLISLDAEAIRIYLKEKGLKASLDDGSIKDPDDCGDDEIVTADTGSNVFLTGNVKILDAIEDITMPIYI